MTTRVKKKDTVFVLSGKDKGKQGSVIAILPEKGKVMVKGVAVAVKHVKSRKKGQASAIKKEETFIDLARVMPVCTACNKPCRVGSKALEQGERVRVCGRCKESF